MKTTLILTEKEKEISTIYLVSSPGDLEQLALSPEEKRLCLKKHKNKEKATEIAQLPLWKYVVITSQTENHWDNIEEVRQSGAVVTRMLQDREINEVQVIDHTSDASFILAFIEGLTLANYRFSKYITQEERLRKKHQVGSFSVISKNVSTKDIAAIKNVIDGVCIARDLVNEPVSSLNAEILSREVERLGKEAGFSVEVLQKAQITSLRMGGLLAVNQGSVDPPTFSILEWKPDKPVNMRPYVLVGKGVVFDTGGLSLKPTKDSMDLMKSDMGGAAAVAGSMYALAMNRIPVHVIGLIPATDNRPGGNAYAPGDVITMMDGTTVEVLNTDAEGRMILADALSYAKRYNPKMVIELSTLTGAAAVAIGTLGLVGMGNAEDEEFEKLQASGEVVRERLVRFPFWKEYEKMLESDVADIKNIGGREGGAITAGKFLEHFTDYPFIHLDIAGPAFLTKENFYQSVGGTGVGVRLLYHFIRESVWPS